MAPVRLHPFHFAKYLRYGLVLCVVPVLRALFVFDVAAAWLAFTQSLAILFAFSVLSALLWRRSKVVCTQHTVTVSAGLLAPHAATYFRDRISAVEVQRTVMGRLFGAARLTLYFKSEKPLPSVQFTLRLKDARRLETRLVPAEEGARLFVPGGFERLRFVMLSANVLATCALSVLTVWRVTKFWGGSWADLRQALEGGLGRAEHLLSAFLPAGISALVTLIFFFGLLSILRGYLATAGFSVQRSGNVLLTRGGLFTRTERRVILSCVNSSSIHITPWARLLRQYPVYVTAGGFKGHELPLATVRPGSEEIALRRLLPEFCMPTARLANPRRRHLGAFLWKSGLATGAALALLVVSVWALPAVSWALGLGFGFGLMWCVCDLEAFFKEGVCKNDNRTFSVQYSRGFTRYLVSLYTNDLAFQLRQHPIAANEGRCDVRVFTPSRSTYRVRSVEYAVANRLSFNM